MSSPRPTSRERMGPACLGATRRGGRQLPQPACASPSTTSAVAVARDIPLRGAYPIPDSAGLGLWGYPARTMRSLLITCCAALLAAPSFAAAQEDAEQAAAPPDAGDDGDEGPADEPPPDTGPREATTSDPMPAQTTSSVVVDEREAALRREQAAFEEESEDQEQQRSEEDEDDGDGLDHEYQVGLRAGIGVPFVFALRYGDGAPCDRAGEQFCLFVGSTIITFDVSFGVTPDVEIVLGGRIGAIQVEPTETNTGQISLGIRAYISPESLAKVYLAPSLVLDLTPNGVPAVMNWGDVDFGVRGAFGVVVDPIRYLGLYVEIGVNILFLRSFGISPDVTGGFQVRFP